MTTIKTTCSRCGDVELTPQDLVLELGDGSAGAYRFSCPLCGEIERRGATPRVVSILLATGVPLDVSEPSPISEEEIDRFVAALEAETNPFRLLTG
jgi:predicted RNA-binding Zn-ribbon protein involved in translation (DUF1610 family)